MVQEEGATVADPGSNGRDANCFETTSIADSATPLNPATENSATDGMSTNGDHKATPKPAGTPRADAFIMTLASYTQLLFDLLYLCHALPFSNVGQDADQMPSASLEALVLRIMQRADIQDVSMVKMKKSALDYWRKTYLLFGLLCAQ